MRNRLAAIALLSAPTLLAHNTGTPLSSATTSLWIPDSTQHITETAVSEIINWYPAANNFRYSPGNVTALG